MLGGAEVGAVAHVGEGLAGRNVKDDRRRVVDAVPLQPGQPPAQLRFDLRLKLSIEGGRAPRIRRSVGMMGEAVNRQLRHRSGGLGQGLRLRQPQLQVVQSTVAIQAFEEAISLGPQLRAPAAGVHQARAVGEDGQQGRFGPGQRPARAPEVSPCSRLEPDHVAPEGGELSVGGQDLALRSRAVEAQGQRRLFELLPPGARRGPGEADDLHGDGARPADRPPRPKVGDQRPHHRERIYARVVIEPAVLEREQRGHVALGERGGGREPPLLVVGDPGREQPSVTVDEHAAQRPTGLDDGQQIEGPRAQDDGAAEAAPPAPKLHSSAPGGTTSTQSPAV